MSKILDIDSKTLKFWLDNKSCLLIDVRENFEYEQGYIGGAINIPLSQLPTRIEEIKNFQNKIIVLSCKAGIRSRLGGEALEKNGFSCNLYNLENGILGWIDNGFQILTKNKP